MTPIRMLGRIAGVLLVITALASAVIVLHGWTQIELRQNRRVPDFHAATDPASLARGRHLVEIACAGCHSPTFAPPLAGSSVNFLVLDSTQTIGTLWAPNLTPGGVLARASDGQLARAVREGIGADGRVLLVMPSAYYHAMPDSDLAAILGFLRSQPTVTRVVPSRRLGLTPYVILGLHQFPTSLQPPVNAVVPRVPEAATARYGEYLASLATCGDCHGAKLLGNPDHRPGPHAPPIARTAATLDFPTFDRAMRGGIGFTGKPLDPSQMPFGEFRRFTDVEARAIYEYVHSLSQP
jgi:mono/diheme cytochrome c family protein